jgi:hypothetical protein
VRRFVRPCFHQIVQRARKRVSKKLLGMGPEGGTFEPSTSQLNDKIRILHSTARYRTVPHSDARYRTLTHSDARYRTLTHSDKRYRTLSL